MLIQEMHNKIELGLQKMGSHAYDWIQPEQVDSMINDAIVAYVKNKTNSFSLSGKGPFSRNVKALEDLRTITIHNRPLFMNKVSDTSYFAELPSNYEYFVQGLTNTGRKCDFENQAFPSTTSQTRYIFNVDIPVSLVSIVHNGKQLFSKFASKAYQHPEMSFMLYNELVTLFDYNEAELFFDPVSSKFTIITRTSHPITLTRYTGSGTTSEVINPTTSITFNGYVDTGQFKRVKLALTNIGKYGDYLEHPFANTSSNRPVAIIHAGETPYSVGRLQVITNERFILSNVDLTYIRRPAKVSLSLNISCDLPVHTHEEIVDKAILIILETIESRRVQSKSALNQINE